MEQNFLTWLAQNTKTVWWHDSANISEQEKAFSLGATGMTTNPFLVNQTLQMNVGDWKGVIAEDITSLSDDDKAISLIKSVTGYYAEKVAPLFDKGTFGAGYVCAQTNPNKTGNYAYMLEQAKCYASWYPNIVIKLPATNAGIRVFEECVALGLNVAATVSFSVPQVIAVAEARKRGKELALSNGIKPGLSIAVLMVGRLDDYLRDVANDQNSVVTEADIKLAGTACMKRAYSIFNERGYDTVLMPAGCRGAHHITSLAGAKMIMSISPKIQKALLDLKGPFEEKINEPVDPEALERLSTLREFRKAFEPDGMSSDEFITFGSSNRTIDQFINSGWNPLLSL
ncbi:transaldolase family protein [Oceanispirochaeta crateris]|nr:transaldolase family protein [Oceanispirochaeta crateris]